MDFGKSPCRPQKRRCKFGGAASLATSPKYGGGGGGGRNGRSSQYSHPQGEADHRRMTVRDSQLPNPKTKARIHVHLGKASSKERIEYTVENPIRAAVRMNYLMQTNKAVLNNAEFFDTLYERLLIEETKGLEGHIKRRVEDEIDRVRKLVIAGKMDPPPGMEYLYYHPLVRCGYLMKEMDRGRWDSVEPPPAEGITLVEPYEFDGDEYFKRLHATGEEWIPSEEILAHDDEMAGKIARAQLRLREKRARQKRESKGIRTLYSNKDHYDINPSDSEAGHRQSVSFVASDEMHTSSFNRSSTSQETSHHHHHHHRHSGQSSHHHNPDPELHEIHHEKHLKHLEEKLLHEKEVKMEAARQRQEKRFKLFHEAQELERLEHIDKYEARMRKLDFPSLIDVDLDEHEDDPRRGPFAHILDISDAENKPDGPESFTNLKAHFGLRGRRDFSPFFPIENPLVTKYIDAVTRVEDVLHGASDITGMYEREQSKADDFLRKLNRMSNNNS